MSESEEASSAKRQTCAQHARESDGIGGVNRDFSTHALEAEAERAASLQSFEMISRLGAAISRTF